MADIALHVLLGFVLSASFVAAALSRRYSGSKKGNIPATLLNIFVIAVCFAILVVVMKFVRNYEPRSWLNLATLLISWVSFGIGGWQLLFRTSNSNV